MRVDIIKLAHMQCLCAVADPELLRAIHVGLQLCFGPASMIGTS